MISFPGKCPSCGKDVASLRMHGVDATESGYSSIAPGLRAITLCCPNLNCGKVLGAQVDPIALRTDIVEMTADQVVKKLRGLPPT